MTILFVNQCARTPANFHCAGFPRRRAQVLTIHRVHCRYSLSDFLAFQRNVFSALPSCYIPSHNFLNTGNAVFWKTAQPPSLRRSSGSRQLRNLTSQGPALAVICNGGRVTGEFRGYTSAGRTAPSKRAGIRGFNDAIGFQLSCLHTNFPRQTTDENQGNKGEESQDCHD